MYNYELSDEARQKLLEAAAWAKAGLKITEEKSEEPAPTKNKKAKIQESRQNQEEQEVIEEECETCPVCMSELSEPLSESRLVEHLNIVLGLIDRLQNLNESEESDLETIVAEVIEENIIEEDEDEDFEDEEDEEEEEDEEDLEEEEG